MNGPRRIRNQQGFTLIEAMISIVVLTFGVLSLAAIYGQGIFYTSVSQFDYIAEKKAEQAVEAIFAARDTGTLTWDSIQNVGAGAGGGGGTGGGGGGVVNGGGGGNGVTVVLANATGVFLDGPQPILLPGPDGLVGTTNDQSQPDEVIITGPGPDGKLGTPDDTTVDLNPWMTRTIAITAVNGQTNLRQVTVTVNYTVGQMHRSYTLISYISSFS